MADTTLLSKEHIDSIVKEIESVKRGGVTVKGATDEFCKYWASGRVILEILKEVPVLAILAGILIKIGDAYSAKNCTPK